ncbi:MAG: class D beta-lactamase [Waterburya sp.]
MNRIFRQIVIFSIVLGSVILIILQSAQSAFTMSKQQLLISESANVAQQIDFQPHFQELEVEGSILIQDLNQNRIYQYNPQRNATPFLPASTFKIPNSLISLETGVIPNELTILTWDGVTREVPEWNRDLNMKEAFKLSAIWFYQILARRVGYDRMQEKVKQVGYGNSNIGSLEDIDKFWLEGELRITPQEQIQFLRRFYNDDLPFSERSLDIVKDVMLVEATPNYTLRVKTGLVGFPPIENTRMGWYVGYLEQNDNVYFFATNIDIRSKDDVNKREELTRRCLEDLQLL